MALGRIGTYDLLERIGEGGMGIVFRAHDVRLGRTVAVKVLAEPHALDPDWRARLLREARAEARLNHPNIAACYDVGEAALEPLDLLAPGTPGPHPSAVLYLAMELVPGEDLAAIVAGQPLPLARVLDLATQIAAGLEHAHASGVVHRDLKPGNVRVTPEGRAKILDFGLAHHDPTALSDSSASTVSTSRESTGSLVGTVLYMSPEQAAGQSVDARSDLFSFGVVLYELVTGRRPFGGADLVSALYALANEQPAPLGRYAADVPDELQRIVGKLLEKSPAERYQSAHEVLTDLRRLQSGDGSGPSRSRGTRRRTLGWLAGAGLAVIALALWLGGEPARRAARTAPSLAVLGFENATGDTSLGFLCAGLAADLASDLVQEERLNVSPGSEVMKLARDERTPRGAAHALGVTSVLTGALRRVGHTTRLQVELVDGRTGFVTWTEGYDLEAGGAFALKRRIVEALAGAIAGTRAEAATRPRRVAAPPAAAYEEYLRGLDAMSDPDDPGAPRRADSALANATTRAPAFTLAWAARARALAWRWDHERDAALLDEAQRCADRALALDPASVPARVARARVYRLTGQVPQAIADLDSVLRINPELDEAWSALAGVCTKAGDLARAEQCSRQAVTLRPAYAPHWHQLGNIAVRRGRYEDARAAYGREVALAPEQNLGWSSLAAVEMFEGRFPAAVAAYERMPSEVTDGALASNMANAYFWCGRLTDALRCYLQAVTLEPNRADYRANLGDCDLKLGRNAEALRQYREAVRLDEADLAVDPHDAARMAQYELHLAKSGACDRAWRHFAEHRELIPANDAEIQHTLAKTFALCGRRDEALAALRRVAALGAATGLLRSEDEFASLRSDSAFRALVPATTP